MSAIRRIDHDRVLDLWALGHGSVEIARMMSLKGPETARTIIGRARRRGDPRALSRGARPAAAAALAHRERDHRGGAPRHAA